MIANLCTKQVTTSDAKERNFKKRPPFITALSSNHVLSRRKNESMPYIRAVLPRRISQSENANRSAVKIAIRIPKSRAANKYPSKIDNTENIVLGIRRTKSSYPNKYADNAVK